MSDAKRSKVRVLSAILSVAVRRTTMAVLHENARMMPPATTLGWVERSLTKGSEIRSIEPLRGSRWHASHALRIVGSSGETYDLILRRWARPGWDAVDPDFDARREAAVLRLVEELPTPTPHLVAADPDAQWCDVPTLLTTRLAGGPPGPSDDLKGYLQQLADALLLIHRIDCAPTDLPYYRSWSDMAAVQPAAWASESPLWPQLFEYVRQAPPVSTEAFIHRDYHASNSLWVGPRLTGIVDWSTGSWGPVSVDLPHMRWNLACELGPEAPDLFLAAYERAANTRIKHNSYWDAVELVDGVGTSANPPPASIRTGLELYVERVLRHPAG